MAPPLPAWLPGWGEVSGSLGDLGTFLPLLLGLATECGLSLGTTLIVTGVYNLATGLAFGIPMPVQPMKSIAAIALSEDALTVPQIMAAGMCVSAVVLLLGATGLIGLFNRLVPKEVVRGMQLGLGIQLAGKGIGMVLYADAKRAPLRPFLGADGMGLGLAAALFVALSAFPRPGQAEGGGDGCCGGGDLTAGDRPGGSELEVVGGGTGCGPVEEEEEEEEEVQEDGHDSEAGAGEAAASSPGVTVAVGGGDDSDDGGGGTVLYGRPDRFVPAADPAAPAPAHRPFPAALLLVAVGLALAGYRDPSALSSLRLGPERPSLVVPSAEDFRVGFWRGAVPQLPLTTLNSVISVCDLSATLFPARPAHPRAVAVSVGAMNLAGCWVGAMPCCHGAGGLAAQYRFGARTGAAVALLGAGKLAAGLLFGGSSLSLLAQFPGPVLGVLLAASGVELASACRVQLAAASGARGGGGAGGGLSPAQGLLVMLVTAAATVATRSTAVGFAAGAGGAAVLMARELDICLAIARVAVAREARHGRGGPRYTELGRGSSGGGGGGGGASLLTGRESHDTGC